MMGRIKEFLKQLQKLWNKLDTRAKIIIGSASLVVFTGLIFLVFVLGDPNYQPIYEDLAPEDASAIVDELENRGVSYRLQDGGATVLVPSEHVHDMRLALAGEDLPTSGQVGFEVFDDVQFGTTDFERRVNLYRAMGGELSRSIETMNAVSSARVQITAPEESLFISEERPAEASVMLDLESGHDLSPEQSRAIGDLVASGVPDLQLENVTIVDTAGNLLAPEDMGGEDDFRQAQDISSTQREMEREYEDNLRERLNAMLTRILGPDNFTVQVESRMDFDLRERESHTYLPVIDEEGLPRSREELREIYYGGEVPEDGGEPGTASNIPGYLSPEDMEEEGFYERTEETINYEMDEVVEREEFAPGSIEQLSVSVMVDEEMGEDELLVLEESIQAAVGFDDERGDTVNVTSLEFDRTIEEEMAAAREREEAARRRQFLIYSGLIVGILLLALLAVFLLRRRSSRQEEMAVPEGARVDMMVEEEEEEIELPDEELSEDEKKVRKMREELHEMAEDQPEEMAELIKSWLMEE